MNTIKEIHGNILSKLSALYDQKESNAIAFILLEYFLRKGKAALLANSNEEVTKHQCNQIEVALERLLKSEPIQYILEEADFLGRKFWVNTSVMIPRPETEELVLEVVKNCKGQERILDIGTGSGVIAISLALEVSHSGVKGIDVSESAIKVARSNADKHSALVKFDQSDFLRDLPHLGVFDIIVSNPPYIMHSERGQMSDNVINFEPELALFVPDNDPLLFYQKLAVAKDEVLTKSGKIFMEINEKFADAIVSLFRSKSASSVEVIKDINGKDRIIVASFG